jgi:threonine dehydrogenase-like Zn-dependent dehydrogenase
MFHTMRNPRAIPRFGGSVRRARFLCGTDLHILKGDVPTCEPGRTLGHEAVGTVVETGDAVENVHQGDRVLVSCISACGRCQYCRQGMYGQCQSGGGWILGHLIDGTQAELVRIPFADNSLYKLPEGLSDEQVLFLSDILPTGFEVGVRGGNVRPGDVVVVGAGPVGLAAMMTARLYGPSRIVAIDKADSRLDKARSQFGADLTVNGDAEDPIEVVQGLTGGLGADVAIEAVGVPRRSSCAPSWCGREGGSPTSASTAVPPPCTWSGCGSVTSPSPPGWWTPRPRRRCCGWWRSAWTRGRSPPIASARTRSWTPTGCSPTPPRPTRSRWS